MPFDNPKPVVESEIVKRLKCGLYLISREHGWCKNKASMRVSNYPFMEAFCAMGALARNEDGSNYMERSGDRVMQHAATRLQEAAALLTGIRTEHISVPDYNDHSHRTLQDVQCLFEVAIELEERGHPVLL